MANQLKKNDQLANMQNVRKALAAYYKKKTLQLAGDQVKAEDAIAEIDAQIARMAAADEAKRQYRAAVREQKQGGRDVRVLVRNIQKYIGATEGEASKVYIDFGFSPRKAGKVTAETRAQAVVKTKATRAARHTMGKNQRRGIHVVVEAHGASSSASPASPASPAPSTNGASHVNGGA